MADPAEVSKSSERPARTTYGSGRPAFGRGPNGGGAGGYDDGGYYGDYEGIEGRRRYAQIADRHRCRFCREKLTRVDYKDLLILQKLCTSQGRIFSRKRSGNCAAHQRMTKKAIKQARFIGLLPFTS
ncbi:MAG: 30S ribosomal protein S18 [Planctomycetes bacterium]|nr:30S ribosomal protein S18 [Planctomycetota bacterium]